MPYQGHLGYQFALSFLMANTAIVSHLHFAERTIDLSNGLIWPKDG